MIDPLELFYMEANDIAKSDQLFFALALLSPFCGLLLGLVFFFQSNNWSKWIMSFLAPLVWSGGFGYLLLQLPSQEIKLLIIAYGFSIFISGIYFLCMFILYSSEVLDWIKQKLIPPANNHHSS